MAARALKELAAAGLIADSEGEAIIVHEAIRKWVLENLGSQYQWNGNLL